jgi:hypothetical protein
MPDGRVRGQHEDVKSFSANPLSLLQRLGSGQEENPGTF